MLEASLCNTCMAYQTKVEATVIFVAFSNNVQPFRVSQCGYKQRLVLTKLWRGEQLTRTYLFPSISSL